MKPTMCLRNDRSLRLLPLGDSITHGSPDKPGGYRGALERRLLEAGWNFEFVGSRIGNSEGMRFPNHEGHPGFRIEELRQGYANAYSSCVGIAEVVATTQPDCVLLLVGTNNLYFDDPKRAAEEMNRLWDGILSAASKPRLLVGTLPTILPGLKSWGHDIPMDVGTRVAAFNGLLASMVESRTRQGWDVCLVNVATSVVGSKDLQDDGVHPLPKAMERMGEVWWRALEAIRADPTVQR
ncbi:MAG: GDSL-type esterase/lipase family protein [Verrucomicrobiota bacterium]